jgi:hypothetical protein
MVPPLTNGVLEMDPEEEISVVSVVNERVNNESVNGMGVVDPVWVMAPVPVPCKVKVIGLPCKALARSMTNATVRPCWLAVNNDKAYNDGHLKLADLTKWELIASP